MSRRIWWLLCTAAGLGALLVLAAVTGLLMLRRWEAAAGQAATPGLVPAWLSPGLTAVDDELTRFVRLAQASKTRAESRLPATMPSAACSGLRWSITTQPNGDILIAGNAAAFRDSRRVPSFRVRAR